MIFYGDREKSFLTVVKILGISFGGNAIVALVSFLVPCDDDRKG